MVCDMLWKCIARTILIQDLGSTASWSRILLLIYHYYNIYCQMYVFMIWVSYWKSPLYFLHSLIHESRCTECDMPFLTP